MPIAVRCSHCAQALKVPDRMAGRKGKCPKCGAVLAIPAAEEEEPDEPTEPTPRKKRPPQPAIIEEKAVRPRRRPNEETVEEEEEPEETAPRVRDIRKKKKKRKSSSLLWVGILGGGFALLLVCSGIGGFTWWYFSSKSAGDDFIYMPSGCQMIASIRMDQLLESQAFQDVRREIPDVDRGFKEDFDKGMGLAASDMEQVVIGSGPGPNTVICVCRTKKPVEAKELRSRIPNETYTEKKVGKYVVHEPQSSAHPAFCVLEKKRVLVGDKAALTEALQRDKKQEFSRNLQDALKQVDFSKTIAFASDATQTRPGPMGGGFPMMGGKNDLASLQKKINGFALQATVGSDVRFELGLICPDAAAASDVKKGVEGFLSDIKKLIDGFLLLQGNKQEMKQEISDLLQLNLKVDGNKVTGGNTIKVGALIKMYKQQKGQN